MYDVFISYKREDRDIARQLAEAVAARGYRVWWDTDLLPGDKFAIDDFRCPQTQAPCEFPG